MSKYVVNLTKAEQLNPNKGMEYSLVRHKVLGTLDTASTLAPYVLPLRHALVLDSSTGFALAAAISPVLIAHSVSDLGYLNLTLNRKNVGNSTASLASMISLPGKLARLANSVTRFIALWETFQSLWQELLFPNCPHFKSIICKGGKIFHFSSEILFGQLL